VGICGATAGILTADSQRQGQAGGWKRERTQTANIPLVFESTEKTEKKAMIDACWHHLTPHGSFPSWLLPHV
jgi:hypothetical protein